jgi:hypothetical protein
MDMSKSPMTPSGTVDIIYFSRRDAMERIIQAVNNIVQWCPKVYKEQKWIRSHAGRSWSVRIGLDIPMPYAPLDHYTTSRCHLVLCIHGKNPHPGSQILVRTPHLNETDVLEEPLERHQGAGDICEWTPGQILPARVPGAYFPQGPTLFFNGDLPSLAVSRGFELRGLENPIRAGYWTLNIPGGQRGSNTWATHTSLTIYLTHFALALH